ncbi:hypothetical protein N0V88_008179 [Collariella sp. IMI 366227]|nr:hypothetical protein N0V88_008179 [Collariella sp. IMI 366227]
MSPKEAIGRRLAQSHAKEGDIPGTVNLNAKEGDDTGYGQALFPVPAEDPNDPLQWSTARKNMILLVCALYSFLANTALLGPAVYIGIFAQEFNVSPNDASNIYAAGLLACSQVTTFGGLMAARIAHCFGASVCEALPVQLVNDIFFLHERGKRLGYYTAALCLGGTGPFFAGYMLAGDKSWRLYFYVEFAFACALFILAFFVVEETLYYRNCKAPTTTGSTHESSSFHNENEKNHVTTTVTNASASLLPRKTYVQTLKFWGVYDKETNFFLMIARSFTYFLVPHVFWVITTYGIYIGLAALTFNYTFPMKITAPPYNWSQTNSGLISIATFLGYILAIPFTNSSDRLAAHLTKKNAGIREAEMRLGVLVPVVILAPLGLIVYGFAAERNLHWVAYFAGVIMTNFGSYFYFTFTLAYAIDSYTANVSEMLIAMNLGKQAISFGMGLDLLSWVMQHGYTVMIAGVFCVILLVNNLGLVVFMLWGKRIRRFMAKTWLARVHRESVREVATH